MSAEGASELPWYHLTAREREIVTLVVAGHSNRIISQQLWISESTVNHHLNSIFNKTGMSSRLELALFAVHHHFVERSRPLASTPEVLGR